MEIRLTNISMQVRIFCHVWPQQGSGPPAQHRGTSGVSWRYNPHYKFFRNNRCLVLLREKQCGAKWDAAYFVVIISKGNITAPNHVARETKTLPKTISHFDASVWEKSADPGLIKTSYCMKMGTLFLWAGKSQSEGSELWVSSIWWRLTR